METFKQILAGPVWDGDLVSKAERDRLKEAGFIDRGYGFNYIATKGIEAAVALGLLPRGRDPKLLYGTNAAAKTPVEVQLGDGETDFAEGPTVVDAYGDDGEVRARYTASELMEREKAREKARNNARHDTHRAPSIHPGVR